MSYTVAWLIFGLFFVVVEGAAIVSKAPGATLTAHIVKIAALRDKPKGWLARRGALAVFFGWLVYHFVSRTNF